MTPQLKFIMDFMIRNNIQAMVWDWSECPFEDKWSLGHGGDEDNVILYNKRNWRMANMVEKIAVCDYNEHEVGDDHMLAVTAHS